MSQKLSAFAKKRKANRIRRNLFLAILLIALLGTASYFALEKFFVANEISVMKSDIYKTADISATAGIKKGTPIYKINRRKIVESVEKKFPYLEDVKITYKLPDQIKVNFREEYGNYALVLGVELFALDDDMRVLAKEKANSEIERIKIISGDVKSCIVGSDLSFIDEDTAPILRTLVKSLKEKKMLDSIRSINVTNQFDIRLDYEGKFDLALGDHLNIPVKLAMIKEILLDLGADASGQIDISDCDQAYVKLNDAVA